MVLIVELIATKLSLDLLDLFYSTSRRDGHEIQSGCLMLVFTGLANIGYIVATCICKEYPIWSNTFSVIGDFSDKKKIQPRLQPPARPNMSDPGPAPAPVKIQPRSIYTQGVNRQQCRINNVGAK